MIEQDNSTTNQANYDEVTTQSFLGCLCIVLDPSVAVLALAIVCSGAVDVAVIVE